MRARGNAYTPVLQENTVVPRLVDLPASAPRLPFPIGSQARSRHLPFKQGIVGSNPTRSANLKAKGERIRDKGVGFRTLASYQSSFFYGVAQR